MPEIKHNFTGGKMNKDLDERLVRNGEYRDAMNIQVSTSEGSDVGTVQNILGNSLVSGQGFIPSTASCVGSIADEKNDKLYYFVVDSEELIVNGGFDGNATNWDFQGDWSYLNGEAITIGAAQYDKVRQNNLPTGFIIPGDIYEVRFTVSGYEQGKLKVNCYSETGDGFIIPTFTPENKEYSFKVKVNSSITTNSSYFSKFWIQSYDGSIDFIGKIDNISVTKSVSYVVEYDTRLQLVKPVVVDTNNRVLSFHSSRLITGANIIDNLLFWTDNYSEPKKINIHRCIRGTDKTGTIHTKLINESRDINIGSGIDLEEEHITVIRKSPRIAPTIELISGRNAVDTYSGIMRITTDPGGLTKYEDNNQNASSMWFADWSSYNHLYDFSTLSIGSKFRTRIETDINGESGFDLDWGVGDVVVFKEFSGDDYEDAPLIPITDYTIKAKILDDGNYDFSDSITELAPNNDFTLPSPTGARPSKYVWTATELEYNSLEHRVEITNADFNKTFRAKPVGIPSIPFVQDGTYKIKIKVSGVTPNDASIRVYISGDGTNFVQVAPFVTAHPYWFTPDIYSDGEYEFDLTLSAGTAGQSITWMGTDYEQHFFVRTRGTGGDLFTGNIDSISIERQGASNAGMKFEILSMNGTPKVVPNGYSELKYGVDLLNEEENLFEFKLPRFAYRYQYEDKEYSNFSPFTQVAFLPGSFDFHPQKGYNLGMTNGLKKIKIRNFIPDAGYVDDVVAVDILYKDESSPNIYVIDTIKNNHLNSSIWDNDEYTIESESVKRVLPSNQLLRPWDAVPKKALAQEISGNRIIYGNYTQGFDLFQQDGEKEYYADLDFSIQNVDMGLNTVRSIKSLREYQLGVVFIDKYGRETPVLSNSSGLDKVLKLEADKSNRMEVSFNNTTFPEGVEYFKFFVKETSGEYYNMTMDRWWNAGDGLVWLSFGSADINKIDIDTFLILKKGVESNDLVTDQARYKVLAIETEAPDYIKTKKTLIEERKHTFVTGPANIFGNTIDNAPLFGKDNFKMRYQGFASGPGSELHNIEDGILYVEFVFGSAVSKRYRITDLTTDRDQEDVGGNVVGPSAAFFSVRLDENLGEDVNFICDDPGTGLNPTKIIDGATVRIYKYTPENSNEFDGRFFVKVISDGVFIENISTVTASSSLYRTTLSKKLYYMGSNQALLHQETLTGQTLGLYQDAGTPYPATLTYSGGGGVSMGHNLSFGSFASFFRNYKHLSSSSQLINIWGGATEDIGQYRFDDTSSIEWQGEFRYHTANDTQTVFNWSDWAGWNTPGIVPLKNAEHSGFSDNERYGIFNNKNEQTKGNVWFIDGGPFTGSRWSPSVTLHWTQQAGGNGFETGVTIGSNSSSMVIAMGGIYIDTANTTSGDIFNIGDDSNTFYKSQKFKNLVGKISPQVKFRFKEDPSGEIYTIKPSGISFKNRIRWSDGDKMPTSSGEYPAYTGSDHFAPQLSPNMTRGYSTVFTNDRTDNGTFNWDPTNAGQTGPIPAGLHLTTTRHTGVPLSGTVMLTVAVNDIHNLTCSVNGGDYSITKGMILTSYGGTILDGTFTNPEGNATSSGFSHEPLIVQDITGIGPYLVTLTGYSSPILGSDLSGTGLLKHKIFDTAPAANESMVFQQPAMNGYSQYSVNRINMQDANGDGSSLTNPALLAVGYTIEFLEEIEIESEFPDNPAIWETEPKESTDLDVYYEASGYNPVALTDETVNFALPLNSGVTHVQNTTANLGMVSSTDAAINSVNYNEVAAASGGNAGDITGWSINILGVIVTSGNVGNGTFTYTTLTSGDPEEPLVGFPYIDIGDQLLIDRPDGSSITVTVKGWNKEGANQLGRTATIYIEDVLSSSDTKYTLNWYNCFSFGNGVESNRVRDTYNLAYIANGVKASTTLDEHPYEENLKYGLIYSGIYNGSVGMNNLNQFIAAEKITKTINPTYGSIQKLKAGWGQGGDLITLCEDRVLKILANKDALFNADGNTNLTSTNNVLGQAIPYSGEYGISTNPESFASDAYRAYFTDKVRGAVMRLSIDGLTPISNAGMKDWFRDNLKLSNKLIGSYDDRQDEYNISLEETTEEVFNKVTVTGIQYKYAFMDGRYFFFEIEEMKRLLGGSFSPPASGLTVRVMQYRNNSLYREDDVKLFGSGGNSLNPPSPSGGPTKGHGRWDSGITSAADDWEVGDIIVIGSVNRSTFYPTNTSARTVSYKEDVKGWVSFKSFIKETGVSCANGYYTFASGRLWKHHVEGGFSELTKVTVTGIEHANGPAQDGKYFFFEIHEMEKLVGGDINTAVVTVKQYRNNSLYRQDDVVLYGNAGNSLNPPSDSGGPTKGHGRWNTGTSAGDFEVGDIILIHDNTDRNTFYNIFTNSSFDVLLNDIPSSIKSYHTLGYEGSQSRVIQNLGDNEYYNLTDKDGWFVSSVETDKKKGSLMEFIEKEGKWFNYIKGVQYDISGGALSSVQTNAASFDTQGLGVLKNTITSANSLEYQTETGTGNTLATLEAIGWDFIRNVMEFDGPMNASLQIGDIIYYRTPGGGIVKFGVVTEINGTYWLPSNSNSTFSIKIDKTIFGNPTNPVKNYFIFFVKNQVVNMSGLAGYYANARFQNNSKVKAELFAVSSEVTESSK